MRILICDDEEKYLTRLKIHISEYMKNHFIQPEFFSTTSANEVLNNDISFDLAFLDIQMPEVDGITVAKALKERNQKVILFFVTAFEEHQDEAMNLHIFRFFEKPFDVKRLYSSLDKAMEYIDESYIDIFINDNMEYKKILIDNIVYIRREGRKTVFLTIDGKEYISRTKLEDWIDKFPNTFFYLVHKSFFINLHYITKCNYTELYLQNTIRVPIATRKQADFHKYWYNYLQRR